MNIVKKLKKRIKEFEDGTYWKWKFLPSPTKLGMSDSDALGMRDFAKPGQATWEDWDERVKAMYPVRHYVIQELWPDVKAKYHKYVWEPYYWAKCHIVPSQRFHMLDLRQPKGYKYGWIDSDTKMIYALFNILNMFVEDEMSQWYCPSEEEIEGDSTLLLQRNKYMEVKAIHYWWNVERPREQEHHADLLNRWSDSRKDNLPETQQLWDDLHKVEEHMKTKENEMLDRLLKVRHWMWT